MVRASKVNGDQLKAELTFLVAEFAIGALKFKQKC